MIAKLKRRVLTLFVRLIPQKYHPSLIRKLEEKRPRDTAEFGWRLMDYPKSEIYLSRGIRTNSCQREPETVKWVEAYFKPGQVFYDVGANIGAYSLIAAKYYSGTVKVYAFEPAFQTFPLLVSNIIENGCSDVIFPLNVPLGEIQTMSSFNYTSLKEGKSGHAFGATIDYKGKRFKPVFKQLTIATTIDKLIQNYHLPSPNHIKLDVDGLEFQILKGAKATISGGGLESLLMEGSDRFDMGEVFSFIETCGLQLVEKHEHPATSNYIFVRRADRVRT